MKVTVFGGASPKPDDPAYKDAFLLGTRLAKMGHTVMTGGYGGTMEAVSRGTVEAGGHTIGVTCEEIEQWRPSGANNWVIEEWRCCTLMDRMEKLIVSCDTALALPGGPGTLAEICLMWNRILIQSIIPRPLILIGEGWKTVFFSFFGQLGTYIKDKDRNLLSFADDVPLALDLVSKINSAH